jgi:HEAT repeat protein
MTHKSQEAIIKNALAALHSDNPYERFAAIETLARYNHTPSVERIIRATQDTHQNVREAAVWALGDLRSPAATDTLHEIAENTHYTYTLRWAAIHSLGMIGDVSTLTTLFRMACSDPSPELRQAAGRAILRYEDSALTTLSSVVLDRQHETIYARRLAARLLGELRLPGALPALMETIIEDVRRVRWQAVQALGEIGSEDTTDFLIMTLDNAPELGRITVWALERIGTLDAVQTAERWRRNHHFPQDGTAYLPPRGPDEAG